MVRKSFPAVLFLFLLIPACQPAEVSRPATPSTAQDEAAIREILQRNEDSWNAADPEAVLKDYAEDIVQMPPEEPAIVGKEALRASWREFLDKNTSVWDLTTEDIQISGDLAFARGAFTSSNTEKEDGEVEEEEGNTVFVLRRESDGTWRIVIEIWTSNDDDDDDDDDDDGS